MSAPIISAVSTVMFSGSQSTRRTGSIADCIELEQVNDLEYRLTISVSVGRDGLDIPDFMEYIKQYGVGK